MFWMIVLPWSSGSSDPISIAMWLFFLDFLILKVEGTAVLNDMYWHSDTVSNSRLLESSDIIIVCSVCLTRHKYTWNKILSYWMLDRIVQCTILRHVWKLLEMCELCWCIHCELWCCKVMSHSMLVGIWYVLMFVNTKSVLFCNAF